MQRKQLQHKNNTPSLLLTLLGSVLLLLAFIHTVHAQGLPATPGQSKTGTLAAGNTISFELPAITDNRQGVSVDINITATGVTDFCVYIRAGLAPTPSGNLSYTSSDDHVCLSNVPVAGKPAFNPSFASVYTSATVGQQVFLVILERKNAGTGFSLLFNQGASACSTPNMLLSICQKPEVYKGSLVPKRSILYKGDDFLSSYITELYVDCGVALKSATCSRTYSPCNSFGVQQQQCRRACAALQSSCTNVLVNGKPIANIQCENNPEYTTSDPCFYAEGTSSLVADIIIKSLIVTGTILAILVVSVLVVVIVCCLYYAKPKKAVDYRIL